jgi:hypothetical protein
LAEVEDVAMQTRDSGNTTSGGSIDANLSEMRRALKLLHPPGQVFEIRALGQGRDWQRSGYFNDYDKAVKTAAILVNGEPDGVYVKLNPVNPALLSSSRYRGDA